MNDREMDEILEERAAGSRLEPALLERVTDSIQSSMRPVRPLPPTWVLASGPILICAAVALAGAARAGFYGIEKMSVLERALIFPTLGIFVWVAAAEFVSEMIPGSRRRIAPGALLGIGSLALLGLFAVLFRDYRTDHFVSAGIVCLMTGLLHAVPDRLGELVAAPSRLCREFRGAGLVRGHTCGSGGRSDVGASLSEFPGAAHTFVAHRGGACERGRGGFTGVGAPIAGRHRRSRARRPK